MSAINDIVKLAEKLKAAEEKIARLDSLEQAIGEAEARLAGLRADEVAAERARAQARAAANEQHESAKVQAEAIRAAAVADARRVLMEAEQSSFARTAEARQELEAMERSVAARRADLDQLWSEKKSLEQAVATLKLELESLRARLNF